MEELREVVFVFNELVFAPIVYAVIPLTIPYPPPIKAYSWEYAAIQCRRGIIHKSGLI